MTNPLLKALDELSKEEQAKKKPVFKLRKEKRLQYCSGWHEDDKAVTQEEKEKKEKQKIYI